MPRLAVLSALLIAVACCPSTPAADKPAPAADKPAPADKSTPDLSKKFVIVSRVHGQDLQQDLLKKIEFRKLGDREFLVGEYCVNPEFGVEKEWEGVEVWVPVQNIEAMMVFGTEAKAWEVVKKNGTPKLKD